MAHFSTLKTSKNQRLFAIGDIHGCHEELKVLIEKLRIDSNLSSDDVVIFLGDYIDRGPDSKKVIDTLIKFKTSYPNTRFLKGNHEDMLLHFLGFKGHYGEWCIINGGKQFFKNYGFKKKCWRWKHHQSVNETAEIDPRFYTQEGVIENIPKDHMEFLLNLESAIIHDDFLFVHAGVDVDEPLTNQTEEDLCWIRDAFLLRPHTFPQILVHGHTPTKNPYYDPFLKRVNIDTGCFKGGHLTAVELRSMTFTSIPSRQPLL